MSNKFQPYNRVMGLLVVVRVQVAYFSSVKKLVGFVLLSQP